MGQERLARPCLNARPSRFMEAQLTVHVEESMIATRHVRQLHARSDRNLAMTNSDPKGPPGARRVFIRVDASTGSGWAPKLLAVLLGVTALAGILLLFLGLWVLFALSLVFGVAAGLLRAVISRRPRTKSVPERDRLDDRSP
jgi:hypothetical protein